MMIYFHHFFFCGRFWLFVDSAHLFSAVPGVQWQSITYELTASTEPLSTSGIGDRHPISYIAKDK